MPNEASFCAHCGASFVVPQEIKALSADAAAPRGAESERILRFCPSCRPQKFAEETIGNELQPLPRHWPLPKRRSEERNPIRKDTRTGATVTKSQCYICNSGCDALVFEKDGRVIRVEGDPSSAITKGTLCCKGLASREQLYHEDRLLYPMKRMGERGSGRWQRISWDEALDTAAERFKGLEAKYGPDSIVLATGTKRGTWCDYFMRFANAWGKQFTSTGWAQCAVPRQLAGLMMLGGTAAECPDFSRSRCLLVWGANPVNNWPHHALSMMEAWAGGAPLIVVDSELRETPSKADIWLQPRPGTDSALGLGFLNVIIEEGLYDKDFVDRWCTGFEELKARAKEYPLDRVEKITWVPREKIRRAARLYATSKPACLMHSCAIEQNADTMSSSLATVALTAITGNLDIPGGNLFPMFQGLRGRNDPEYTLKNLITPEKEARIRGSAEYPLLSGNACMLYPSAHNTTLWKTILSGDPYPVRGMYIHACNLRVNVANTRQVEEALKSLDFILACDIMMNPTVEWADIVLPATTWIERDEVTAHQQASIDEIQLGQTVLRRGECRTNYAIINDLARRLGVGNMFPSESDEPFFDFMLEKTGLTWKALKERGGYVFPTVYKKYEQNGFGTPSKKVELANSRMANLGMDPLPGYREPDESPLSTPDLAREYPLIITTGGRTAMYRHSEGRNIAILRELMPHPLMSIHPATAGKLGIQEGDEVIVETPRGTMEAKAYLTEGIHPGVVQLPSHWEAKQNVNIVMDNEHCAPHVGSTQLRGQLCRVKKKS
jgi:anaerobic selenocysteine-containing dehydrogenase